MYSRCCAVFSTFVLMSLALTVRADASFVDESILVSYQDWSGAIEQTTLSDGSVLSEYVAKTHSGNVAGAVLLISFSPRFNCKPAISIVLPGELENLRAQNVSLVFTIDKEKQDFPVLIDAGDTVSRYSLNAASDSHQLIREKLDNASRVTVLWELDEPQLGGAATDYASAAAENSESSTDTGSVFYSLLGSRMTAKDMDERCHSHEPIPFDN